MPSLFLATCDDWPSLPENLKPLVQALHQRQIEVKVAPWQSYLTADLVWPICAWDYATHSTAFIEWLIQLEQQGIKTVNPVNLMYWNMHKTYLQDLAKSGINVTPSYFVPCVDKHQIKTQYQQWLTLFRQEKNSTLIDTKDISSLVFKPAIGQSGKSVVRWFTDSSVPDLSVYQQGLIVQPYIAAIERYGETSLIFFNGKFSHAVMRQPPLGEWRANSVYGVQVFPIQPSQKALQAAQKVIDYLQEFIPSPEIRGNLEVKEKLSGFPLQYPPAYARIDGIDAIAEEEFLLNECELIEPALYWHIGRGATERFVDILLTLLPS